MSSNRDIRPGNSQVYHGGVHILCNWDFRDTCGLFFNQDASKVKTLFNRSRVKNDLAIDPETGRHRIRGNHRVHIFLNRENASLTTDALGRFIRECHAMTGHKVVIHIPCNMEHLRRVVEEGIRETLLEKRAYLIITEKRSTETLFWQMTTLEHTAGNGWCLFNYYVEVGWLGDSVQLTRLKRRYSGYPPEFEELDSRII